MEVKYIPSVLAAIRDEVTKARMNDREIDHIQLDEKETQRFKREAGRLDRPHGMSRGADGAMYMGVRIRFAVSAKRSAAIWPSDSTEDF